MLAKANYLVAACRPFPTVHIWRWFNRGLVDAGAPIQMTVRAKNFAPYLLTLVCLGFTTAIPAQSQAKPKIYVEKDKFDCFAQKVNGLEKPDAKLFYLDLSTCPPTLRRADTGNQPNFKRKTPRGKFVDRGIILTQRQLACLSNPAKLSKVRQSADDERYLILLSQCQ